MNTSFENFIVVLIRCYCLELLSSASNSILLISHFFSLFNFPPFLVFNHGSTIYLWSKYRWHIQWSNFSITGTKKTLVDIIEDEKCYYKVRCEACHALTKVSNAMPSAGEGPPALLVIFKKLFGSFANSSIVMQNDFSSLQKYFLQKEIPLAMAALRNSHNICPPEVIRFLLDLFKYNDNSKNTFSDNYYRAAMVEALGETVTPVVSVLQVCTVQNIIKQRDKWRSWIAFDQKIFFPILFGSQSL